MRLTNLLCVLNFINKFSPFMLRSHYYSTLKPQSNVPLLTYFQLYTRMVFFKFYLIFL